jgi:hypothetical protein
MSRSRLSLFAADRAKLDAFASELRAALWADDREKVVTLLDLDGPVADRIRSALFAVDVFLASESYPPSAPVFVALRHAARDRALTLAWTSDSLALEGRLRGFEPLREEPETARRVDALLDGKGVDWFLRRPGDTCGCLSQQEAEGLAEQLEGLEDPPEELVVFGRALGEIRGTILCHDALL